ncbi:MAG: carbon-nitrogen hydrolase family protein [Candidatus Dormibacteraceae bacterium]
MRVALSQMEAGIDKAANLAEISAATGRAAGAGAQLIVFPEAAMLYSRDLDARQLLAAERLDGPFGRRLAGLAAEHRIVIVCGVFEQAAGESVYNTVVVYGADGRRLGEYRKIHLFDAFDRRESDLVEAGEGDLLSFSVQGLTFGVMNAYDVRFPELARELVVDRGAQVLLLPAAWVRGALKEDHWEVLVRARAIENTVYVLAADQVGQECCGSSMIVDPMGVPLARGGETAQLVLGEVSAERVREVRKTNPSLENRRLASIVPDLVGGS